MADEHIDIERLKKQLLQDAALQSELLNLASVPHKNEDGSLYIPPRILPPQIAQHAQDMMDALGIDNVMQLTDMAYETLYWALGERIAGKQVGSVTADDEFSETPVRYLLNIDMAAFEPE